MTNQQPLLDWSKLTLDQKVVYLDEFRSRRNSLVNAATKAKITDEEKANVPTRARKRVDDNASIVARFDKKMIQVDKLLAELDELVDKMKFTKLLAVGE